MSLKAIWSRLAPPSSAAVRYRVLLVCLGNICRSPTAEAVLHHKLHLAGLGDCVEVDSAGTYGGHAGARPDERACKHAARRGYELAHLRARKVADDDFVRFDLLLAMDGNNLATLRERCPSEPQLQKKLRCLVEFIPATSPLAGTQAVPDPYYGGPAGFEHVLDLVEAACDGLVEHLRQVVGSVGSGTRP